MSYRVLTVDNSRFRSDIKKLKKQNLMSLLFSSIKKFADNPYASKWNTRLLEPRTDKRFRLRIGDYRVIYSIDIGNQIILIHRIGLRKDIYRS